MWRGLSGRYRATMTYGLLESVHGLHNLWFFGSHLLHSVTQACPKQAMHVSSIIIVARSDQTVNITVIFVGRMCLLDNT